ncbi:unnamed protein product [Ectocarpus sp. 12 AP-2014]
MSSSSVQSAGAIPSPTDARAARGPASTTGSAQMDREALLHFYRTTGGESWTCKDGWAENADDLGSWHGVTTNAEGRVVKLELEGGPEPNPGGFERGNSIIGAIPPEFGRLGALTTLYLGGNQLSGKADVARRHRRNSTRTWSAGGVGGAIFAIKPAEWAFSTGAWPT